MHSCRAQLLALLEEGLLDLVFANEEEAVALWRAVGPASGEGGGEGAENGKTADHASTSFQRLT